MNYITWSEDMSVGVTAFDNEHKQLIDFVNKLNHAIQAGSTGKTTGEILHGLIRYTKIHFKHEEDYMVLYDYPGLAGHRKEHDALTSQVADFYDRFTAGKATFTIELMKFLRDWLTGHIMGVDMKYKAFFKEKNVS